MSNKTNFDANFAAGVLATLGIAVYLLLTVVINGIVLSFLWDWFVVPVLPVPSLSLGAAIGIGITVSFLTKKRGSSDKDQSFVNLMGWTVLYPLFVLFVGWIVHFFV